MNSLTELEINFSLIKLDRMLIYRGTIYLLLKSMFVKVFGIVLFFISHKLNFLKVIK